MKQPTTAALAILGLLLLSTSRVPAGIHRTAEHVGARNRSAGEEPVVRAGRRGNVLTLDNGLLQVRLDAAAGRFSVAAGARPFIDSGRFDLAGASAALGSASGPLGSGRSIEVSRPAGQRDRLVLYPGLPFVCLEAGFQAGGPDAAMVERLVPAPLPLRLDRPPAELRVLGCDGLTAGDRPRTSYTFLAAADPQTRTGVVAGWLTGECASGIVRSRVESGGLTLEGQAEYGSLPLPPGGSLAGETLAVGYFADCLQGLEAYAAAAGRANRVRLRPPPCGYCTWYSRPHGGAADEQHLAELADFAKRELEPFGFQVVQIDDRWQVSSRDYTTHNPAGPYPGGMQATAGRLRDRGLTPGIWFIPFGWDPARPALRDHPEWFVHRPDGSLYEVKWAGTCLDMTHPGARAMLRETVARITREWGYRYLKIDGLWSGMATEILYPDPKYRDDRLGEARFYDARKKNIDAYRDGLRLVREAAGDDVYILGCNVAQNMRTLGASFGLVDGMRVGRDIGADWGRILPCVEMGTRLYFLHGRVWHNDPDCLMLREPLTLEQARGWGSWIALSGQLNLVSEWLPGLPPERLEIVKRSMPNTGRCGRPLDLFERPTAQVWQLTGGEGPDRRDVVGLFNWDRAGAASVGVDVARLGLPGSEGSTLAGFDFWANRFLAPVRGRLQVDLPPGSCRVIALRSVGDHPCVVSTSRHISQGMIDVRAERWRAADRSLSGESQVVGADPYELRVATPAGGTWRVASADVSPADRRAGVEVKVTGSGPDVRVTLASPAGRTVRWRIGF